MEYGILLLIVLVTILIYCLFKKSDDNQKYPIWEKLHNPDGTFVYRAVAYSKHKQKPDYHPYLRTNILSEYEYQFWEKLYYKCNESNLIAIPKVRMLDIVHIDKNYIRADIEENRIQSKHIDFIICDSRLRVLATLEFDDNINKSESKKIDIELKTKIFNKLDIPFYIIKREHRAYNDEITRIIYGLKTMNGIEDNFKPNYSSETVKLEGIGPKNS